MYLCGKITYKETLYSVYMKKIFTLFSALGMMLASSLQAQDWTKELVSLNPDVIDSVVVIKDTLYIFDDMNSYMIYYHQPLKHDAPELGSLPLRALMTTYSYKNLEITNQVIQMHIGGYELQDDMIAAPNTFAWDNAMSSIAEVSGLYNGHLLQPEHRFFGKSLPENPGSVLGYCTAEEAAADFHALVEAMKKVFYGKWAITGVSKGGGAAAVQHAYYPDDADCFVSYVAPFLNSLNDMRPQEYLMTQSWTPELRDYYLGIVKKALNRPEVFKQWMRAKAQLSEDAPEKEIEKARCAFLLDVMNTLTNESLYTSRDSLYFRKTENNSFLESKGLEDYSDLMLYCMVTHELSIRYYITLAEFIEQLPQDETRAESNFTIPEDKWVDHDTPYNFECVNEKGYYNLKWDYFYDTQEEIDSVNGLWQRYVDDIVNFSDNGLYSGLTFKSEVFDFVLKQTAKATKPMLFIYGGDDFWTGAHIEDQYINGDNVRRYILPEQNHTASIHQIKDEEKKNEIFAFLDKIFRNNPDAIEQIEQPAAGAKTRYNLMGQPTDEAQGLSIENGRVIFKK